MTPPVLPFDPIRAVTLSPAVPSGRVTSRLVSSVVVHPRLRIAHDQTMDVLTSPADHPFVLVVGPGGVGKTALVRSIENALAFEARHEMAADLSLRPAIRVDAPASSNGRFDFASLWYRVISAAEGPADRLTGDSVIALGIQAAVNGNRGDRLTDLKRAAVRACVNRGVRTILLDEANHLSVVAGSARAADELEILKDFAMSSGVRILLVGAFPVLAVRDISFQVARRIRTVPFLGYAGTVERDRAGFRGAAAQMLGLIEGIDAELDDALLETLLAGSAGCIGSLRNWLVAAEHHRARTATRNSFAAVLRETAYPPSSLRQARAEIEFGNRVLAGEVPARPERPYAAPTTAGGQSLKPGEARPIRRDMPAADRA